MTPAACHTFHRSHAPLHRCKLIQDQGPKAPTLVSAFCHLPVQKLDGPKCMAAKISALHVCRLRSRPKQDEPELIRVGHFTESVFLRQRAARGVFSGLTNQSVSQTETKRAGGACTEFTCRLEWLPDSCKEGEDAVSDKEPAEVTALYFCCFIYQRRSERFAHSSQGLNGERQSAQVVVHHTNITLQWRNVRRGCSQIVFTLCKQQRATLAQLMSPHTKLTWNTVKVRTWGNQKKWNRCGTHETIFLKRKRVLIKMPQMTFTVHAQTYYSVNLSAFDLKLQLKVTAWFLWVLTHWGQGR